MADLPHRESQEILETSQFFILDELDWEVDISPQLWTYEIRTGLTDIEGARTKFQMELFIQDSPCTSRRTWRFSLFKSEFKTTFRVYQLEIREFKNHKKLLKEKHSHPHEHIGDLRQAIDFSSLDWSFDEALNYFLVKTKIHLEYQLSDPHIFTLRQLK